MAAENCAWQSYNFPFSEHENVSQSFIDYSNASVLNVDLDEHGQRLSVHSKQSHDSRSQRLVAKHPSLPFREPSQRSSVPEEKVNDYQLRGRLRRDQLNRDTSTVHVDNFSVDHTDVMYGTVAGLLQEEINCPPWSTCANIRHAGDFCLPWKRKDKFCQLCSNIRQASVQQDSNPSQVLKHLGAALPDIPPSLLENLLQESIALQIPRFHFDTLMGNSLACHTLEHQAFLMYPSGAGLDILNFSQISPFPESVDERSIPLSCEPVLSKQQFSIQGQIRQIDFSCYCRNNIVVGSRSQYSCSFFQSCPYGSREGDSLSLKPLETVALTKQAMCLAISPYVPGEGVIVAETGGTYLWRCGHALKTICPANQCESSDDSPWYQCVYAANPQCIAMADAKGIDLMDFRAGGLFRRFFFSIPSAQVDSFECISSVQRHPQNAHHYVLATDQSIMILDDRYLQHPVLKWRHHNQDPVQFINIPCGVVPQCDDTVLVASGSLHGQTHCFQYSSCQVQEDMSSAIITEQCHLPPQSTSLPWKVSPYNEWYYTGLSRDLTFSPAIASRLSQPLIGVCTMLHTSHPQKGFTVFQMSAAGDLFYQPFISQHGKDYEEGSFWSRDYSTYREHGLGAEAKMWCQKWIDMTDQQMDDFVKAAPCQFDYAEVEKKELFLDMLSLPTAHISCVLCNDRQTGELDSVDHDSSICERCGLDTSYTSKLVENQKNNRVLTRSSLNIQHEVKDVEIYPDFNKATDPLSKSLWVNWNSDEPIPVFNDEPMPMNSNVPVLVNSTVPVLVNNNEPIPVNNYNELIPVNSNQPTPENSEKSIAVLSSEKQEMANQNIQGRAKSSVSLPAQDGNLISTIVPQAYKIPLDSELKRSLCKRGEPTTSQLQAVENSPKAMKMVKKRTGHMMGF